MNREHGMIRIAIRRERARARARARTKARTKATSHERKTLAEDEQKERKEKRNAKTNETKGIDRFSFVKLVMLSQGGGRDGYRWRPRNSKPKNRRRRTRAPSVP
jgi:hypothetical protein